MSIVSISLNTETRECTMTIDGIQVPAQDVSLYKCRYVDYQGNESTEIGFSYTMRQTGPSGLEETVTYRLPYPDPGDSAAGMDAHGFIVEKTADPRKTAADIAAFFAARGQPSLRDHMEEAAKKKKKLTSPQGY